MNKIKILDEDIVNQIAAGEIVERPGSALKEIVENSIDSGSKNIDIFLKNGGKSKIVVEDDGEGLSIDELHMCIKRHATSKLTDINLFNIRSFGFRGEALPSIAAVSNFMIESKGHGIAVKFSKESDIFPSPIKGTKVTVEDLFSAIPVRMKFLKSTATEFTNCLNIIENFALTIPNVNFSLSTDENQIISFADDSLEQRISVVFGKKLFENAIYFEESDDKMRISGYLFHPIDNRYSQSFQKIFVNRRYVKDKVVSTALKNAYKDLIPNGRYAIAIIFIEIDPFYVDANISPTKSEVRFRDAAYTQKFLTTSISKHLKDFDRVLINFDIPIAEKSHEQVELVQHEKQNIDEKFIKFLDKKPVFNETNFPIFTSSVAPKIELEEITKIVQIKDKFFGNARCQVFNSYIISERNNELVIIDQHAVHEKITQTKMLKEINAKNKQFLLKFEVLELNEKKLNKEVFDILKECGFAITLEKNLIKVSAIPAILTQKEAMDFLDDILISEEILENEMTTIDVIKHKIADKACHNSIRFGRKLSVEEMTKMLEQMEETESIHQCNHHRPAFVVISKSQLEKMFER
ncbi:DNA mismatch repair protein MutL [Alphaproteobacteria bacterium]|nr:DNA mismatch repair protein MutL [Alphaproteobacteria bacterium]